MVFFFYFGCSYYLVIFQSTFSYALFARHIGWSKGVLFVYTGEEIPQVPCAMEGEEYVVGVLSCWCNGRKVGYEIMLG